MAVAAVRQAGGEGEWGGVRCSGRRSWRRKAKDGGWQAERQARGGGLRGGGAAAKAGRAAGSSERVETASRMLQDVWELGTFFWPFDARC